MMGLYSKSSSNARLKVVAEREQFGWPFESCTFDTISMTRKSDQYRCQLEKCNELTNASLMIFVSNKARSAVDVVKTTAS